MPKQHTGRPAIFNEPAVQLNFRIPSRLDRLLRAEAGAERRSISQQICHILEERYGDRPAK